MIDDDLGGESPIVRDGLAEVIDLSGYAHDLQEMSESVSAVLHPQRVTSVDLWTQIMLRNLTDEPDERQPAVPFKGRSQILLLLSAKTLMAHV
ncbi:MAG: hypothetical protein K1X67_23345 [Fimbriimonadaceae bacterium]|nr:hypothetical protein [Fimbriimonadaceae bacterium]